MRHLGNITSEPQAVKFCHFLTMHSIKAYYERTDHPNELSIWIESEDDLKEARHLFEQFQNDPNNAQFESTQEPTDSSKFLRRESSSQQKFQDDHVETIVKKLPLKKERAPLNTLIILCCIVLYFMSSVQIHKLEKEKSPLLYLQLTPLFIALSYDYPNFYNLLQHYYADKTLETKQQKDDFIKDARNHFDTVIKTPHFVGLYPFLENPRNQSANLMAPKFKKISQGQIYRLVTPIVLHGGLLHILFNMLWLFFLGKQVESRIRVVRYVLLTLIIAIISNTLQYLMTGPFFMGYSGVIFGLAGFIWMRQRRAPWEGYPLQKVSLIFLLVYALIILGVQLIAFILAFNHIHFMGINIANTAHISGGLTGIILGRFNYFHKVDR